MGFTQLQHIAVSKTCLPQLDPLILKQGQPYYHRDVQFVVCLAALGVLLGDEIDTIFAGLNSFIMLVDLRERPYIQNYEFEERSTLE